MLNEVLRLTQGDLTSVTENRPIFQDGKNGKCTHGVQFGTECEECIKECRDEFFKNNGENHV